MTLGPDATEEEQLLFFQTQLMVFVVKFAYWTKFPAHRLRSTPLGFGSGEPIFSDPENWISNPNARGTGIAHDYIGWHNPLWKGVENLHHRAFLELDEDAFISLRDQDLARVLILSD